MSTALLICVKAINGGLFVALFAVLGELLQPKRFAGIFGASPAVALGNLLVIALAEGEASARVSATGMIAGAVALAVACMAAIPAVRRWGTVWGSAVLWTVWLTVGGAIALPVAGAASARSPSGLPVGGQAGHSRAAGPGGRRIPAAAPASRPADCSPSISGHYARSRCLLSSFVSPSAPPSPWWPG